MNQLYDHRGNVVTMHEDGRNYVVRHRADVEPVIELNKKQQNEAPQRSSWRRQFGRVDPTVLYQWAMEDGLTPDRIMRMPRPEFFQWVRRKLANADNRHFRL